MKKLVKKTPDVKHCPFCGETKAEVLECRTSDEKEEKVVICRYCGAVVRSIEKWNRRTDPSGCRNTCGGTVARIKINPHGGLIPEEIEGGDWIDLRAAETVELEKGEYANISLGVSMQLPVGFEAHVLPRSSTFKNYGIIMTNSMGIIDNSYCGDGDIWKFPAYAVRDTKIVAGDRIAQFRIVRKQPKLLFEKAILGNDNRGGFGSTGAR